MSLSELMYRGFELLVLGVGTLAVFTTVLFLGTRSLSRFVAKHELRYPDWTPVPVPVPIAHTSRERARIAAATAAVHRHRTHYH